MMGNLRGWEWLILLAIVLLFFGARRLPDLSRSVARSLKIFRSEVHDPAKDTAPPATGGSAATDTTGTGGRPTGITGPSAPAPDVTAPRPVGTGSGRVDDGERTGR